jgi:NAD(P)-dependent dehydrogenase (short-subunit alcohol dehydrogenase family)
VVREHRIDVNSIAPGPLNTRLLDEVLAGGPEKVGPKVAAMTGDDRTRILTDLHGFKSV